MAILSRPVSSTSFRAWETIAGGSNNFLVQQRTEDGLEKNKTVVHRATHKPTDLTKFRIIYSTCDADFNSSMLALAASTPRASSDVTQDKKDMRLVVAVAERSDEILQDWDEVKECWRRAGGTVKIMEWEEFYQGIIRIRAEEAAEAQRESASAALVEPSVDPTARLSTQADEPLQDNTISREESNTSFGPASVRQTRGTQKEDTSAQANHHSGCTDEEVWAARLMSAWLWRDAYQSIFLMVLFGHGYLAGWMSWWTAVVILYLSGLTFPRYRRFGYGDHKGSAVQENENKGEEDDASMGMTGEEIRRLVHWMRRWQERLGFDSARAIQSKMASVVLVNYSMSVFAPLGITLRVIFEEVICPLIAVSLLISFLVAVILGKHPFGKSRRHHPVADNTATQQGSTESSLVTSDSAEDEDRDRSPEPSKPDAVHATASADSSHRFSDLIVKPIKLYNKEGWTLKSDKDGVVFEEMASPYCGKKACKFTTKIPNTTCYSLFAMMCDDPDGNNKKSYAYRFDTLLSAKKVLKKINENTAIIQTSYKSPVMGVSARDMVSRINTATFIENREDQECLGIVPASCRALENGETRTVFIQSGLDYGKHVPETKGFCRGAVHSYLILGQEEVDGSLTLNMTISIDPQGSIPAWVVEATNAEQVKKLVIMRKILAEIGPVKKPQPVAAAAEPVVKPEAAAPLVAAQKNQEEVAVVSNAEELDESVNRWIGLYLSPDWALQQTKDNVSFYLMPSPWCDKKAVKVQMFVPGATAKSLDLAMNNPENPKKYDRLLRDRKNIRDVNDKISIFHSLYASPIFGVAARDFVTRVAVRTYLSPELQSSLGLAGVPLVTEGAQRGLAYIYAGLDAGKEIPPEPKFSRGAVHCFGLFAQEEVVNGQVAGVLLVQVSSSDPCGSIPKSLVDATNVEQMEKLKIISGLMKAALV